MVYTLHMTSVARLFQNGQSQAVRLPRAFRFDGDRVHVRRVGNAVLLLPWREPWQTLATALPLFTPDFCLSSSSPSLPSAPAQAARLALESQLEVADDGGS